MVSLASLWLPIVVSAVLVFLTSSILHMVLKYHRADYRKLPTEDAALEALRGYLASRTVASATEYLAVFRVVGTAAFMGFGLGELSNSIWRGQPWGNTLRALVDGLIYALVTAGTFGWLWPR